MNEQKHTYLLLLMAVILTAAGITIFLLYSQAYLAFSPPWPIGLWNFFGSLSFILLYLASVFLFIWFFQGKRARFFSQTSLLLVWVLLISLGAHFLENLNLRYISLIPYTNIDVANSINVAIGVIQQASCALIGLFFLRRLGKPLLALILAWLTICLWGFILLDPVTYLIDSIFGSQGYFYFWQFEHPEWFLSYWPEFIGTGILVAGAWFVYQQKNPLTINR
ncbi:MAG: hypothetical protein ABIH38_04390 [Patescibacteria group bacterium]